MDDQTRQRIAELRAKGLTPKEISRATKVPASQVTDVIQSLAATVPQAAPEHVLCFASTTWREHVSLAVPPEQAPEGWMPTAVHGALPSLVQVIVAAGSSRSSMRMALVLLDTACLGVKDAVVKKNYSEQDVRNFVGQLEQGADDEFETISLEIARQLVFGAADFARSIGFEPQGAFDRGAELLGSWKGPSVFTFGWRGKPFFINGPRDDVRHVLATLNRIVGAGNYGTTIAG